MARKKHVFYLFIVLLLLTGCSGKETTPTSTPSPGPAATSTPTLAPTAAPQAAVKPFPAIDYVFPGGESFATLLYADNAHQQIAFPTDTASSVSYQTIPLPATCYCYTSANELVGKLEYTFSSEFRTDSQTLYTPADSVIPWRFGISVPKELLLSYTQYAPDTEAVLGRTDILVLYRDNAKSYSLFYVSASGDRYLIQDNVVATVTTAPTPTAAPAVTSTPVTDTDVFPWTSLTTYASQKYATCLYVNAKHQSLSLQKEALTVDGLPVTCYCYDATGALSAMYQYEYSLSLFAKGSLSYSASNSGLFAPGGIPAGAIKVSFTSFSSDTNETYYLVYGYDGCKRVDINGTNVSCTFPSGEAAAAIPAAIPSGTVGTLPVTSLPDIDNLRINPTGSLESAAYGIVVNGYSGLLSSLYDLNLKLPALKDKTLKAQIFSTIVEAYLTELNRPVPAQFLPSEFLNNGYLTENVSVSSYIRFYITCNVNNMFSVMVQTQRKYATSNRSCTVSSISPLSFNLETGKQMQLSDFFYQGTDYVNAISSLMEFASICDSASDGAGKALFAVNEATPFFLNQAGIPVLVSTEYQHALSADGAESYEPYTFSLATLSSYSLLPADVATPKEIFTYAGNRPTQLLDIFTTSVYQSTSYSNFKDEYSGERTDFNYSLSNYIGSKPLYAIIDYHRASYYGEEVQKAWKAFVQEDLKNVLSDLRDQLSKDYAASKQSLFAVSINFIEIDANSTLKFTVTAFDLDHISYSTFFPAHRVEYNLQTHTISRIN